VSAYADRFRYPFVIGEKLLRRNGQRESEFIHGSSE
jgi:hypothetical protein